MNIDTGELRRISSNLSVEEREQLFNACFVEVPNDLEEEAMQILAEKDSAFVDLEKDTPLARWARSKRTDKNKKVKRKMSKVSRKSNRS